MSEYKPLLKDLPIAVIDIETTGLDISKHEIIELGLILYDQKRDQIIKEWDKKIRPRNIEAANPVALEINGYNKNPRLYVCDMVNVLYSFVTMTRDCIFLGANITAFDIPFIEKYFVEFGIDHRISRHRKLELYSLVWPAIKDTNTNLKLATLCDHFGISNEGEHSALVDCRRTLDVYRAYMGLE